MRRSRSRTPLGHGHGSPSHAKHNWNASSHKSHTTSSSRNENFSSERQSSRKRSLPDNESSNIPADHEDPISQPSRPACIANTSRLKQAMSRRRSSDGNDQKATVFQGPDGPVPLEELRKIRVIIRRKTVHQSDNVPINRSVNSEEVVIIRRPGEGTRPIFDRQEIETAKEERTVTAVSEYRHQNSREKPCSSRRDEVHDKRRSDGRKSREKDHSRSHRDSTDPSEWERPGRAYVTDSKASSSKNYHEPSTSKSYHEPSGTRTSRGSSRDYERKKVPRREDDRHVDSYRERDSDLRHSSGKRQNHNEKPDRRKSTSPQLRGSEHRNRQSNCENGHYETEHSSSQEPNHGEPYEGQLRPPWPGSYAMEPFSPGPPVRIFRPHPPVILAVPPPRLPPRLPPRGMPRVPLHGPFPPPRPELFMYPRPPLFPGIPPDAPRRRFFFGSH